jgi:hypothetical protein
MAHLRIQGLAGVYQGPAYMVDTEDGPQGVFDSFAGVTTVGGKEWRHHRPFASPRDQRLLDLVAAVGRRGYIDPDQWVELEPVTPLEERWAMAAEAEDEMRHGIRAENDYHGVPHR